VFGLLQQKSGIFGKRHNQKEDGLADKLKVIEVQGFSLSSPCTGGRRWYGMFAM
jgi:hypothetical protein